MKIPSKALLFVVSLGLGQAAYSQEVITPSGQNDDFSRYDVFESEPTTTGNSTTPLCGADPDCQRRELSLRTFKVLPVEVSGGVRFGDGQLDGALQVGFNVASFDLPQGDLKVIPFDLVYLPDAGGFRVRVGLLEGEALFFCNAQSGTRVPPLVSVFEECVNADEHWGIGGEILQFQRDSDGYKNGDSRWAARWIAAQVVYALLGNGADSSYLKKRLNAFLGASLDSVLSGPAGGTFARFNIGMSGLIRSDDLKWQAEALVAYRPNMVALDDYGLEARASILRNIFLKEPTGVGSSMVPASIGIEARFNRWSRPERSFGVFSSTRELDSLYLGLVFRVAIQ